MKEAALSALALLSAFSPAFAQDTRWDRLEAVVHSAAGPTKSQLQALERKSLLERIAAEGRPLETLRQALLQDTRQWVDRESETYRTIRTQDDWRLWSAQMSAEVSISNLAGEAGSLLVFVKVPGDDPKELRQIVVNLRFFSQLIESQRESFHLLADPAATDASALGRAIKTYDDASADAEALIEDKDISNLISIGVIDAIVVRPLGAADLRIEVEARLPTARQAARDAATRLKLATPIVFR